MALSSTPSHFQNTAGQAAARFTSETPSGNIDVAPTAHWILGLKPPPSMDGRVLRAALAAEGEVAAKVTEKRIEATRDAGPFRWIQYLKMSDVHGTRYFDEGNGDVLHR